MKELGFVEVFGGGFVERRFFDVGKTAVVLLDKTVVVLLFVDCVLVFFLIKMI
jgi:hypothetical protein